MKSSPLTLLLALVCCAGVTGCGKKEDAGHHHGHVHTAPHGGLLVEVGEHQFNLELVHDAATGSLTAFVLDGHAENFVRISQPALELTISQPAPARTVVLTAAANAATGEAVGNTSQFETRAEWLKSATGLAGVVTRIEIRGNNFNQIAFAAKKPNAP
ncbi:MAG: hypothetical protein JNN01_16410 [Opitutaceae bacterium]|nr:hypothetical protein [Opitutaceae bacterium]